MSSPSCSRLAGWCGNNFYTCAKPFVAGVLGLSVLLLPCVLVLQGRNGFLEAGAAALLCTSAGLVALAVVSWQTRQQQPLGGMLLAMVLRILPALAVCMLLAIQGEGKQYISFISYLIVFYLVTLALETYLSVQLVHQIHAEQSRTTKPEHSPS